MFDESLVQDLFGRAVTETGAYGAQLSIIKGDQQLDLAVGFADAQQGLAMTADTVMQIGSITKVCTAILVVALAERGLLDLETPIVEYLPTFAVADPHATETITLRHLLSMSSGLDNGRYLYFGGQDALGRYVESLRTLMQHFTPGQFFGYSNAGTCIAGHVAETVAGKPWESLVRDEILRPAGFGSAALLDEDLPGRCVSAGHYLVDGAAEPTVVHARFSADRSMGASGSALALATRDLARLGRMFLNGGRWDSGQRTLSEAGVAQVMERQVAVPNRMYADAWCLGVATNEWSGTRVWGHAGSTQASSAMLQWIPDLDGVIALNLNTPSASLGLTRRVMGEIAEVVFGVGKPPVRSLSNSAQPFDHRRYVGSYESMGVRFDVTHDEDTDALRARVVPQRTGEEVADHPFLVSTLEQAVRLAPLGQDRFLLERLEGPDDFKGEVDTAFFGHDEQGRATHVIDRVFPMRRVASATS